MSVQPDNVVVATDHVVQTFVVTTKSLQGLTAETLKNLIETRYEVLDIDPIDEKVITRRI